ncbi:hypothetical protein [Spartinivicinus marinus]|nr:hypothetical protein [Spartinivicinus marinus]MCX4030312.1 hypothetical protein [Spartinivicinus marinus]
MYWIMATEPQDDDEIIIYSTPPYIEAYDLSFEEGEKITSTYPEISLSYAKEPGDIFTDSLAAFGCNGLVLNNKVIQELHSLKINNIQYFDLRLIETTTKEENSGYKIANIVGAFNCLDIDKCVFETTSSGRIMFIEKMVFKELDESKLPEIFRLAEYLPLIVTSDRIKQAFEAKGFTGLVFCKPEEFSS